MELYEEKQAGRVRYSPLMVLSLGDLQVLRDGAPLRFPYDKLRALFTFLAVENGTYHRRERLVRLLWPDRPDKEARSNLRTALSLVKRLVGEPGIPVYLHQAKQVRLNPALPLDLDLVRLQQTPAEVRDAMQADAVERALALYRGPFLVDLDLAGCDEFNAWAEQWRVRLREHGLLLAGAAMAFHQQNGRPFEALRYAEWRVQHVPGDEAGQRELMRLLAAQGQTGAVRERFEALTRTLREAYGTEPEPATVSLVNKLCGAVPRETDAESTGLRYLTVLYVFYRVSETGDPEYQAALLESLGDDLTALATEQGGQVVRFCAGSMLIYFGFPLMREDDARQAVATALLLGRHASQCEAEVAMGIHSAQTLSSAWSPDRCDRASSAAMHLAGAVKGASLLVSAGTAALLHGRFDLERAGESCFRVIGAKARPSPVPVRRAPLIGREAELTTLRALWREVEAGAGRTLLLLGEPGAGKSRLLQEFFTSLPGQVRVMVLYCHGRDEERPFHPLSELLQQEAGLVDGDSPDLRRSKLQRAYAGDTAVGMRRLATLGRLIGEQEPEGTPMAAGFGQQLVRVARALVRFAARSGPMVIAVEDLHWADPSTLQLLQDFVGRHPGVLLLLTARSELAPERLPRVDITAVLQRLDDADARAMVRALCGEAVPTAAVESIVERSEGVPLFIEELTRSAGSASEAEAVLPMRLAGLLAARLDRLGAAKGVAQCAAVLGRELRAPYLEALAGGAAAVAAPLRCLIDEGILVEMPEGGMLHFHHALLQEAAYNTLVGGERENLHFKVARLLEAQGDGAIQVPERVAWHYGRARAPADAARWWLKAGRRAMGQGALVEARAQLNHGLEQLSRVPDALSPPALERELRVVLGTVLFMLEGFGSAEAAACFDRATLLLKPTTAIEKCFGVHWGVWLGSSSRWGHATGREQGRQLVALAQHSGHPGLQALAWWALGNNQLWLGEQDAAGESLQRAIDCYNQPGGDRPPIDTIDDAGVMAHAFLSWNAWLRGDEASSHRAGEAAFELAEGRPGPLGFALAFAAFLERMKGNADAALPLAERLLSHGREYRFALWETTGRAIRGWALALGRRQADGIVEIESAIALVKQVMPSIAMTYYSMLVEAYGALGNTVAQLEVVDDALAQVDRYHDRFLVAELLHFRGDALRVRGELSSAREAYGRALTVSQTQGARAFERRARSALGTDSG